MKTGKEYPATHSMWTAWFAIDEDGKVAIMECDDNGPGPIHYEDASSSELFGQTLTSPTSRVKYTDEQLLAMMANSTTPDVMAQTWHKYDYENIWSCLCEIDSDKLAMLKEAASLSPRNRLICLSKSQNLWYLDFHQPHFFYNDGGLRYRPTEQKKAQNEYATRLYRRLFDERAIIRMVDIDWPLSYEDEDDMPPGYIRREDTPFVFYFQETNAIEPAEKLFPVSSSKSLNESQLPEEILKKAVRFPLIFSETDKIQYAQFMPVTFYMTNDDWIVDGMDAQIVQYPNGELYFVGQGCRFMPIPIKEAFESHKVKRANSNYPEYRINGERGYLKYDNQYHKAGSSVLITPKVDDIIELVEDGDD